jgi:hypothetical protein
MGSTAGSGSAAISMVVDGSTSGSLLFLTY